MHFTLQNQLTNCSLYTRTGGCKQTQTSPKCEKFLDMPGQWKKRTQLGYYSERDSIYDMDRKNWLSFNFPNPWLSLGFEIN
jgi:hypothetical protein